MRRLSELSREIDECEQDVIAHRERLSGALSESSRGMRRGATSPGMLLGTVLAGFIVGRLTLRPEPPSGGTAPAVAKGAGAVGLLSGLAWAVVRGQLATPDSGLNRWLHERMQRGRGPADASMPRGNGADGAVARDGVAGARGGGFRH